MRSPADRVAAPLLAAGLALAAGCAFEDGAPWGRADPILEAAFAPGPDRLDPEGRLLTSSDYAIAIARLAVRFDAISLLLGGGGEAASGFDPANPPPGYGLCHGGHCHADDGRLVPYGEIAAEAGGGGGANLAVPAAGADVALGAAWTGVPLEACPDACRLERGRLAKVQVAIDAIDLDARVFDRRTGTAARLPEAGVAVRGRLAARATLSRAADAGIGPGQPVGLRVHAAFELTPRLFDGVDWHAAATATAGGTEVDPSTLQGAAEAVAEAIGGHSLLDVVVERFD